MEVVVLKEFGMAVFGDFRMNGTAAEFEMDGFQTGFRFVECRGHLGHAGIAVFAKFEAGE